MDTAAVEGYHYKPDTTAVEAQRIGLEVIRKAVGEDVLLDKDGSAMLPPVGIVDEGRISGDTAHNFANTRSNASGIAARFYMHRNFFVNDPDAFNLCQGVPVGSSRQGQASLSLPEAQASIAIAALSGGMFEIGDDLPTLGAEKDRLALVKNPDLIQMAKISRAATPVDLMTYEADDEQPSIFFLREDARQSILAVFNWTDKPRSHTIQVSGLGLTAGHAFQVSDVLNQGEALNLNQGALLLQNQAPHSVRMVKLIDNAIPAAAPEITAQVPSEAVVSEPVKMFARAQETGVPALAFHWDFGDGTTADGLQTIHAYTRAADFTVRLTVDGSDGIAAHQSFQIKVSGTLDRQADLTQNRRYTEQSGR